ncbi:MAG TPA: alkaline phosphatase D family protein [Kofleriaceae bacterium]|nr:alkaline phosphatase D family protein [Kofleriaceae bacterium]
MSEASSAETDAVARFRFPQGLASGDPRASSVVLWTRIVPTSGNAAAPVRLRVQVATDVRCENRVVDREIVATEASDHTVRVLVTGLRPATRYHYRFVAGRDSITGQTRTAPSANADVQVNLAWVSCQDYSAGFYGAYRQMIVDDDARPEADRIHAVVHLGDMIYETRADAFQAALDDNFNPIALTNADGTPREVPAFPSGGGHRAGHEFAQTLADYRHLYKTYLSDPDIQAARARWPFVSTWDDHEFTDDCWQSQANYTDGVGLDEGDQTRRLAASQAWFEFVPVQLTGAGGVPHVPNEAHDFAPVAVSDATFTPPNDDNFVPEPNNAAAIGAIAIYRSLRFGRHVELVMTDQRSYRSDHAIPEELTQNPVFFAPRAILPLPLVNTLDAGRTANNNDPPDAVSFLGGAVVFPNLRKASPPGTVLGKAQKAWWKATMKGSNATWKLWGNEVTLMRLKVQQLGATDVSDRVLAGDSWDGYATERNELMGFLRSEAIQNVVVLSGDIHAAFAGTILDNYDAAAPTAVACELVAPGITSNSLFSTLEAGSRAVDPALRGLFTVDASASGGARFTENVNLLLLDGVQAAGTFAGAIAQGAPVQFALAAALGAADPNTNPHLKYVDSNAQGYGYTKVTASQIAATIVTINRPVTGPTSAGPGVRRAASFTIPKDNPAGMTGPVVTGEKPFPLT